MQNDPTALLDYCKTSREREKLEAIIAHGDAKTASLALGLNPGACWATALVDGQRQGGRKPLHPYVARGYLDFMVSQSATAGAVTGLQRQVNASGTMTNLIGNTGAGACVLNLSGSTATALQINAVQVVGARNTGWTAMTGTGSKAALAAAAAGTASAAYVQAELQGALNRIAALEARMKSYDDAFFAHGLVGA